MTQTDLFDEPHIQIPGNEVLAKACNRLLLMYQQNQNLFDGDTMGEIDRKIFAEILWEDGVQTLVPADKKPEFIKIVGKCPEADVLTRARRFLQEKDMIRLSLKAVKSAEQFRSRIAGSVKK